MTIYPKYLIKTVCPNKIFIFNSKTYKDEKFVLIIDGKINNNDSLLCIKKHTGITKAILSYEKKIYQVIDYTGLVMKPNEILSREICLKIK